MTTEPAGLREALEDDVLPWLENDRGVTRDDVIKRLRTVLAWTALATPDEPVAGLDVERLARAMDIADPPVDGGGYEDEDHAEHLSYAKEIAAEYARLREKETP